MISDNPNSVAATQAVLSFFDFVQNPEKFKKIIEDLRSVNEERKKVTALYLSVEDFNRKAEDARIAHNRKVEAFEAEKSAAELKLKKERKALDDLSTKVAERERRAKEFSSQTTQKASGLASREAAVAEAERRLAAERADFDTRAAALAAREKEVAALHEKLNAALKAI